MKLTAVYLKAISRCRFCGKERERDTASTQATQSGYKRGFLCADCRRTYNREKKQLERTRKAVTAR
jgi:tRNA(Ile2) C34 agmatinyltransferase TiaS